MCQILVLTPDYPSHNLFFEFLIKKKIKFKENVSWYQSVFVDLTLTFGFKFTDLKKKKANPVHVFVSMRLMEIMTEMTFKVDPLEPAELSGTSLGPHNGRTETRSYDSDSFSTIRCFNFQMVLPTCLPQTVPGTRTYPSVLHRSFSRSLTFGDVSHN